MTNTQSRLTRNTILILLLATCHAVMAAPPVKVESADPPEAEQATFGLQVRIGGSGFDTEPGAVTAVRFVLPGCVEQDRSLCPTGGVAATVIDVPNRKTIVAVVDVDDLAIVAERDIEVSMTRGRGGKGTTLFRVREKNTGGPEFTTCTAEFFPGRPGICKDLGGNECDLRLGNPERIKLMTEDCITYETIVLDATEALHSDGNIEDPASYFTMTAMGPFIGNAVLENAGHRATVRGVNIVIDDTVGLVGCGELDIQNAVRFVLDENTVAPDPIDENRASILYVNAVDISTPLTKPLCEAIVVARAQDYFAFDETNDWKTYISGNNVRPSSYIKTGIRFQGIKQQQDINPVRIDNNVVGAPVCSGSDEAVGIVLGPMVARDFDPSSEALVEGNTVNMVGAACTETAGIKLLGNGDTDMAGNINNNSVTGGKYGVRIDANAVTDGVNMKGNTLTGVGGDAGVCSNIPVGEKGKPNNISGYAADSDYPCP